MCRANETGGIDVVLVGRSYENLWTIPKGTPNPNEPPEFTAVREVTEETGLEVQPIAHLRDSSHTFIQSPKPRQAGSSHSGRAVKVYKTVHWYLMRAVGGDFSLHDDEFDRVRWWQAADAARMLTYGNERRLIDDAAHEFRQVMRHNDTVQLASGNTSIRSKRLTDAWDDYIWRSDPELAALDSTAPIAVTFDEYQRIFAREFRRPKRGSLHLAIEDESGTHIGNCMCYDIDSRRREAEFGIMIGRREFWNRGYGTKATRLLINHAFENLPVNLLFLHTLETNSRAQSAFANAGFRPVGTVRKDGSNFVRMEITAAQRHAVASPAPSVAVAR